MARPKGKSFTPRTINLDLEYYDKFLIKYPHGKGAERLRKLIENDVKGLYD
jgi:hypothetical protein